ncbi:hypothetical protein KC340_g17063, partial [Hortaea werneckii]
AIKSLSAPPPTSNEGYAPERLSGLDRVALSLGNTTQRLRTHFESISAEGMATIRTTRETTVRLNSRIENLERAERAKSAKIESQSRQISELERVLATKVTALEERDGELAARTDELSEKNDALVATCQQLEEMTDNCESLEQQLRERPATPMSSNRSRPQPHSLLPTTFQMPDDLVDHEQEGEQDVQDQQTEQEGYQEHQPDDQLSGPVSSDSSTSQGEEDETPIVRRDLEQLEVGLTIVVQNSEGRLVYQGCPGGLLKSIILRQLAEFRAAYGDGYVGHFSGSHRTLDMP